MTLKLRKNLLLASIYFMLLLPANSLLGKSPSLNHSIMSVYAVDCESGKVLMAENCDLSLTPASCMKIVTTAAALHLLGPNYRLETHLEYDGYIDELKILHGNIYIRGGGDPCLGSNRIEGNPSWNQQINIWADAIQKLGIHTIKGTIIADATKWEKALAVPSWCWEDLGNYYGAGASALSFHENQYSIFFKPGNAIGQPTSIVRLEPPLSTLDFQNELKTGPKNSGDCAYIYGSEFSNIQFLRGTIPMGVEEFSIKGMIPDPAEFCIELLKKELLKRTIKIENISNEISNKRQGFHTDYSPMIKDIVYWTNQKSINLYAEHLLKIMGDKIFGLGSTESGVKAVTVFFNSQNIDLSGFGMADGSGLSRRNLLTTRQLVHLLVKMKQSTFFPIFLQSLPQKEGSLRAKSGSMSLIRGYAGYTDNIAFAIIINNCSDQQAMKDQIKDTLQKFSM